MIFFINSRGILDDWNYWFFEIEHFICGFLLALLLSYFFHSKTIILFGVGILGVIWECFEYSVIYLPVISGYLRQFMPIDIVSLTWQDTLLDIVLNVAGALLFFKTINKRGE